MRRHFLFFLSFLLLAGAAAPPAGAFVYWSGASALGRADLDGAPDPGEPWLASGGQGCGVAVDGAHAYWTTRGGAIGRAGLDGGDVEPGFVTLPSGSACGVAVDAGHLYWASATSGKLGRAGLDGGDVEPAWMSPGAGHGCGIAVDSSHVYWATATGVYSAPLGGGPASAISTATADNCGVAVNAAHVYWATGEGFIERAPLGGGPPTPIVEAPLEPCGVALDSRYVYWANAASDTIGRANLDGSGVEQRFAAGAHGACGVAVDAAEPVAGHGQAVPRPPSTRPSSLFRLGRVGKNRRHGTAQLELLLPGPGAVVLAGRRVVEKRLVEDVPVSPAGGSTAVEVPVRPRYRTRALLRTYGTVVAPVSVTFTPQGGSPRTRYTQVWLVLRRGRRRDGRASARSYRSGCSSIFSSCRWFQGKPASSWSGYVPSK